MAWANCQWRCIQRDEWRDCRLLSRGTATTLGYGLRLDALEESP
jgi:hypothetical protein